MLTKAILPLLSLLPSSTFANPTYINGSSIGEAETLWPSQWIHTSQNATLRVLVQGNPSGPAITIFPSLKRDSGLDFDNLTLSLASSGWLVLRPQPRGILGSIGPMTNITQEDLTKDYIDVINALASNGKSFLLGHAAGAGTAQQIALAYPNQTLGVIFAAKASANAPANVTATALIASNLTSSDSERLAALERGFFAPGNNAGVWLDGFWENMPAATKSNSTGSSKIVEDVKILEIIAKEDPFRPTSSYSEMVDVAFPGQVYQVFVEGASHALFPEQPEKVAEAVLGWLEKQVGRK
ncbi:hypothetical protein HII31_06937 [Pseudocercospora fuligena]|uniref:AB hydrolase-1 domain-containing protein n=1 Tax=Pseudocercospora fuligena TaxID=685502 RepID=A0A8H6VIR0_9PEZI|nr:hypothetical protein HII31_06937 [Pseudocercospora fuligena]